MTTIEMHKGRELKAGISARTSNLVSYLGTVAIRHDWKLDIQQRCGERLRALCRCEIQDAVIAVPNVNGDDLVPEREI